MEATIDISLYPLDEKYAAIITDFILKLKDDTDLRVEVNGLSTQIFGSYDHLFEVLQTTLKPVLMNYPAVAVLKIAAGTHTKEQLPNTLK